MHPLKETRRRGTLVIFRGVGHGAIALSVPVFGPIKVTLALAVERGPGSQSTRRRIVDKGVEFFEKVADSGKDALVVGAARSLGRIVVLAATGRAISGKRDSLLLDDKGVAFQQDYTKTKDYEALFGSNHSFPQVVSVKAKCRLKVSLRRSSAFVRLKEHCQQIRSLAVMRFKRNESNESKNTWSSVNEAFTTESLCETIIMNETRDNRDGNNICRPVLSIVASFARPCLVRTSPIPMDSRENTMAEVIQCPCQSFASMQAVQAALWSEDRSRTLIQWLAGTLDQQAAGGTAPPLSCASTLPAPRCQSRVSTSLAILNDIRDACRPFLDESSSSNSSSAGGGGGGGASGGGGGASGKKGAQTSPVVYEEAFPSLASTAAPKKTNMLVGRKKVQGKSLVVPVPTPESSETPPVKPKRRIRPAAGVVPTAAWGQLSTALPQASNFPSRNVVTLPSQEPLLLDSRLLLVGTAPKSVAVPSSSFNDNKVATTAAASAPVFVAPGKNAASAVNSTTTRETKEDIAALLPMKNLVAVYTTLIKSCLVPSSALELHLLIRLLTLSAKGNTTMSQQGNTAMSQRSTITSEAAMAGILSTVDRCLYFSSQALIELAYILRGIGTPLLRELVHCPPFVAQIPVLAAELELWMEEQAARSIATVSTLPVGNQTALLTLPFNQQRDSRHNYKSREDQALYKNREESRDAFLYQLRAFLSVRGKVVDSMQADKAIGKIKSSSRVVVDGLSHVNVSWFAEFFIDLLLQIGLVPLEETDKDLLNIADKDKLQKLHKRFSTKASQTNKSSRKVVADPKRDAKANDAQHYFTGHQEFFYIFITSADSYVFGIHLRNKMIAKLQEMSCGASRHDFERRLMDLQLVARFLGVLIFSPNWQASESQMSSTVLSESSDGFVQLGACGLSIIEVVEKAWTSRSLVAVVPWVVEILRMTTWDRQVKHSDLHKRLLGLLRRIQEQLNAGQPDDLLQPASRQLVVLSTESLFDEVTGLTKISSLVSIDLPETTVIPDGDETAGLDCAVTTLSAATLEISNSHVEELIALVTNLTRVDLPSLRSPGVSRKLRPSVVLSPNLDSVYTNATGTEALGNKGQLTFSASLTNTETSSIQYRLRDAFFHQHGDLKEVCDFAVNRVLRIATTEIPSRCIKPVLTDSIYKETGAFIAEKAAVEACYCFLKSKLEVTLNGTIALLSPPTTGPKVLEMAISLSVAHGLRAGEAMVNALVAAESRMQQASIARDERKLLFALGSELEDKSDTTSETKDKNHLTIATFNVTRLVQELTNVKDFERALSSLQDLIRALNEWSSYTDTHIPAEKGLRSLFESILLLDQLSPTLVEWSLAPSQTSVVTRWLVLSAYIQIAVKLNQFSRHGLRFVRAFLDKKENLSGVFALGIAAEEAKPVASLLVEMVKSRLIKTSSLEDTLLHAVDSLQHGGKVQAIAKECLYLASADSLLPFAMPTLCEQTNVKIKL